MSVYLRAQRGMIPFILGEIALGLAGAPLDQGIQGTLEEIITAAHFSSLAYAQ